MVESLEALCDRILTAKVHDAYVDDDIDRLVTAALSQQGTINRLATELAFVRDLNEKQSGRIVELESLTHLTQYAEPSVEAL